jgi:hypothetical protein
MERSEIEGRKGCHWALHGRTPPQSFYMTPSPLPTPCIGASSYRRFTTEHDVKAAFLFYLRRLQLCRPFAIQQLGTASPGGAPVPGGR